MLQARESSPIFRSSVGWLRGRRRQHVSSTGERATLRAPAGTVLFLAALALAVSSNGEVSVASAAQTAADRFLAGTTVRMCTAAEVGFNEAPGGSYPPVGATYARGDPNLVGYDADLRDIVWPADVNYTVTISASYNHCLWQMRAGLFEMAWAPYAVTHHRESCDVEVCETVPEGEIATLAASCCIDYGTGHLSGYGVAIVLRAGFGRSATSSGAVASALLSPRLVNALALMAIAAFVFAHLIYFAERKANSSMFPGVYDEGVDASLWFSMVTLSTVGYGDKVPKTRVGRMLTTFWMISGVFMFSLFSSSLSAALDNAAVEFDPSGLDLLLEEGGVLCAPAVYSVGHSEIRDSGIEVFETDDMVECLEAVERGDADGVAYDRMILQRLIKVGVGSGVEFVFKENYKDTEIAVAFPDASSQGFDGVHDLERINALRSVYNARIRELQQGTTLEELESRWFGAKAAALPSVEEEYDELLLWSLLASVVVYSSIRLYLNKTAFFTKLHEKARSARRRARRLRALNSSRATELAAAMEEAPHGLSPKDRLHHAMRKLHHAELMGLSPSSRNRLEEEDEGETTDEDVAKATDVAAVLLEVRRQAKMIGALMTMVNPNFERDSKAGATPHSMKGSGGLRSADGISTLASVFHSPSSSKGRSSTPVDGETAVAVPGQVSDKPQG